MNGLQGGDPAKRARALVKLASQEKPPLRWAVGAMPLKPLGRKLGNYFAQADAYWKISSRLESVRIKVPGSAVSNR